MKICVSASAGNLEAQLDPRFGRCSYFVIVDTETMEFEAIPNTAAGAMGGAGIQAAQTVASKGVKAVVTGNVGPNAFQALSTAGIKIVVGAFGTVKEAVEKYKRGELKEASASTVREHFGMGMGGGMGRRRR
jgi:predicted Fe-Mo cluster-binding NifX family protein